jgi:hypothetical protein
MLGATLVLLFQVAAGDAVPDALPPTVAGVETAATPAADTPAAKPKVVCRMENVTGSRARKQKVCKTEAYVRAGDEARQDFKTFQDRASAGGPLGIKPGGG